LHPATRHTTNTLTKLSGHRFGFNNQEKDNEVAGSGNSYTAEYWQYDARLARRWNRDPVPDPSLSDYLAFGNNPILNVDPNGAYFFGLFGSTSEQRRTARDFAAATGGTIKNITSKKVSVEWWTQEGKTNEQGEAEITSKKHSINFQASGGLDYGDGWTNFLMRGAYESSLAFGDYNIYTGYPKGSGALAPPTIDPIDILAGGLAGFAKSGLSQAAARQTGTSLARTLGIAGEEAVGISAAKVRIPSLTGTAKYRIPDKLTPASLEEVKNVKTLSLTNQIKDFHLYS
jgi:hypothetical protein